jgi:hypothetical protein
MSKEVVSAAAMPPVRRLPVKKPGISKMARMTLGKNIRLR